MKLTNYTAQTAIKAALLLCVVVMSVQLAMAQGIRPQRDALGGLKHALQEAGAAALTTDQETALNTLISSFRENNRPQGPGEEIKAARKAYDDAILAGNADAAKAAQAQIDSLISAGAATRQQARINFEVAAVKILTSAQVTSLVQKFEEGRVVGLIGSLAGGPGGPRGFGPGGGPGFGRRPDGPGTPSGKHP
jgi:Spy/CpxP family protein refolding chaperone